MAKYLVMGLVDAHVAVEVEAETVDAALESGSPQLHASACAGCSDRLSVGDVYAVQVIDDGGAGEVVYTDETLRLELATVEQLEAELAKRRAGEAG